MTRMTLPTLFDRWITDFEPAFAGAPLRTAEAPVDVLEFEDRIEVIVDLPGHNEADIEVRFEEGSLQVRSERKAEELPEGARMLRRERRPGTYARSFKLGVDVDVEAIEANFRDGVLRIKLPKSDWAKPRQIPIN